MKGEGSLYQAADKTWVYQYNVDDLQLFSMNGVKTET